MSALEVQNATTADIFLIVTIVMTWHFVLIAKTVLIVFYHQV
jgi:hypothetical protein